VIVRTLVFALMMGALTACASAGGGSGSTRTDRDRLSREELAEYPGSNLYDVIRSQRPAWLRDQVNSRLGQSGAAGPMIYLDGQPFGEIEAARSISTQSVETVRRLTASQAQSRYSMQAARVVIDVTSRRAP
jgi:hypothetical protein